MATVAMNPRTAVLWCVWGHNVSDRDLRAGVVASCVGRGRGQSRVGLKGALCQSMLVVVYMISGRWVHT